MNATTRALRALAYAALKKTTLMQDHELTLQHLWILKRIEHVLDHRSTDDNRATIRVVRAEAARVAYICYKHGKMAS